MEAKPILIELLAPARNADVAIEAIRHGADAVYIGADSHGARASAGNRVSDIAGVVDWAHRFNARVYVTINTLVYDNELSIVEALIRQLYTVGVDALIVQDLGILRLDIPPIALHASTQCDIRTPQKAHFLQELGFSQLVLPRELSLDEISAIRNVTDVPLEAFVHGALCVSYSGDCQASLLATGRSANRGECAQICRLPYDLYDGKGNVLVHDKHLLSLRDMNRSDDLEQMIQAGVSSFKIEGRLKDVGYVKNVTAYYRQALDSIIDVSHGRYIRSSSGDERYSFTPAPEKSFNRGFTNYFLRGNVNGSIASINTPKWVGEQVGTVISCKGQRMVVNLDKTLNNGDGIGYFNRNNYFEGFRINKVDGRILHTLKAQDVKPGTILYRNYDKAHDSMINGDTAVREIAVSFVLRSVPAGIVVDACDSRGNRVSAMTVCEHQLAKTPQNSHRRTLMSKLGGTIYTMSSVDDKLGNLFVQSSMLTDLRRRVVDLLDKAQRTRTVYEYRHVENPDIKTPSTSLSYHDNVANALAEGVYRSHGAKIISKALEVDSRQHEDDVVVMTTRYCLRRELDHCLRTKKGIEWQEPLLLSADGFNLKLKFDCQDCRMRVLYLGKNIR
jgi:putative protease